MESGAREFRVCNILSKNMLPPFTTNFIKLWITLKMVLFNVIDIIKKMISLEQPRKCDEPHLMTLLFDI